MVPGCADPAVYGESWRDDELRPVLAYRVGIEVAITVRDIAETLFLCERHGDELGTATVEAMTSVLRDWDYRTSFGSPIRAPEPS